MAETHILEDIRGGGGSVKVGTTGTISSLMSRELSLCAPPPPSSSVAGVETPEKSKPKATSDEASNSKSSCKNPKVVEETHKRTRRQSLSSNKIQMLKGDNVALDVTPVRRGKPVKKSGVEIVDIRCGYPDKTWVNPIANKLKKLGFSKLSEGAV